MCDVEIIFTPTPLKIARKTARCNIWMTPHQNNDKQMTKIKADDDAEEKEFRSNYVARTEDFTFTDHKTLLTSGSLF